MSRVQLVELLLTNRSQTLIRWQSNSITQKETHLQQDPSPGLTFRQGQETLKNSAIINYIHMYIKASDKF